jgi:hypothetical protein
MLELQSFAQDISNGKSIFVHATGEEEPEVGKLMEPKEVFMIKVVPVCTSTVQVTNSTMFHVKKAGLDAWSRKQHSI